MLYGTYGASLEKQPAPMATPPRLKKQGGGTAAAKKKSGAVAGSFERHFSVTVLAADSGICGCRRGAKAGG